MRRLRNVLVKLIILAICLILFYHYFPLRQIQMQKLPHKFRASMNNLFQNDDSEEETPSIFYIWCIVVKVTNENSLLLRKLEIFVKSLLQHSKCNLSLNFLTDTGSRPFIRKVLSVNGSNLRFQEVLFYNISDISSEIKNITDAMQSHFNSVPGTYYSDSLFFVSLGLYKIAPKHQRKVILFDVDLMFKESVTQLYKHFSKFGPETLFALAPELTPVYYHILWKWRHNNPNSTFGKPHTVGFAGVNSGVVLMHLEKLRQSEVYVRCTSKEYVQNITQKYSFKGHLGDQDFYTLLAAENPQVVYLLPCTWNRQLCRWWKSHGYAEVFDNFARCDGSVNIYHGNCNTQIPVN